MTYTKPRWLMVKNSPASRRCRRCGFDPWVRKIPWSRTWQPTLVFLPGESHGQKSLVGYSPWGCKESDTAEWLTLSLSWTFNILIWFSKYQRNGGELVHTYFSNLSNHKGPCSLSLMFHETLLGNGAAETTKDFILIFSICSEGDNDPLFFVFRNIHPVLQHARST